MTVVFAPGMQTTVQCFRHISAREGVLALWKGFLPYYARCGGHTVGMFVFLEYIRAAYLKLSPTASTAAKY